MKWFNKTFHELIQWFEPKYKIKYVTDVPGSFRKKTIYIIGAPNQPWQIAFECPCGCKSIIQLNLLQEAKPNWKFEVLNNNKIDLFPSVWRTVGCKSHFIIRKNKIIWC